MYFSDKHKNIVYKNKSLLCIGLDIHEELMPINFDRIQYLKSLIEATSDLVCAYKPNIAFFEQYGSEGMSILKEIINYIPDDVPVILDAKRGDMGSAAQAYARAAFDYFKADSITLNPYFGIDSIDPFIEYKDKQSFILCRTTNNSSDELQAKNIDGNSKLFLEVAKLSKKWNVNKNIGLVVGAMHPKEAKEIRDICPEMIFLIPGIGTQGGNLSQIVSAISENNNQEQMIISTSRSVIFAGDKEETNIANYMIDVRSAAEQYKNKINNSFN